MVEKQYAEQRLMPVVGNEAAEYGYEAHTRYFVQFGHQTLNRTANLASGTPLRCYALPDPGR